MKAVFASAFMLFFISYFVTAKTTNEYFTEGVNGVCKSLLEKEGKLAIYNCASLMEDDSEKKLSQRIYVLKTKLKDINNKIIFNAFLREQKAWQAYKKARCKYITSGTAYGSNAYQFNYSICQAVENFRRIETLDGEPGFP